MSLTVKICGLKSADDVAAAVAAGADAVGFVFAESVRRITPAAACGAAAAVPAGVLRVAVMRHPSRAEWAEVRDSFAPDVLQTDIGDYASLDVPGDVARWPVIREGQAVVDSPEVFLYEGRQSGRGETVDWSRAAELARRGDMILAGGLTASNVAAAMRAVRPWGVDVSSGVESQPGVKDPDLVRAFIAAARAAENVS